MNNDTKRREIIFKILKLLESENLTLRGALNVINHVLSHMRCADPYFLPFTITDEMAMRPDFPDFPEFVGQEKSDDSSSSRVSDR
jgi:hypothetical protein